MKIWRGLFFVIGILSVIYYIIMVSYAGLQTAFSVFWLAVGVACLLGGLGLGWLISQGVELPG